ncbi:ECF-type sigma factor [Thalassotalea marina]|uniref:RNA polymerase sigma-70 ECF-like HTH domain-containing protein n=1 Tax=Thalassotalea marina TaxID=1673741 RepID=A0A919ENQ2_9GAMM|nr:ECF-type sigma factor [Thalassotalea marina]GHG03188.1 hypothetical protein GCM10017161_35430 [Thalassotalea marina]
MEYSCHSLKSGAPANFTQILNCWVVQNDLNSANQLRSIIYYHLKGIVKKQITNKSSSNTLLEQLPNTTSLLHEVLVQLSPPKEIFDNREQFFTSLASFVRWVLLDDLKAKSAKKRTANSESLIDFISLPDELEPYINFDNALSKLANIAPRSYQVALLHYFLGYDIDNISAELTIKKSTVYNELSVAKAYLRTQC